MKRLICSLLIAVLLISAVPVLAAESDEGDIFIGTGDATEEILPIETTTATVPPETKPAKPSNECGENLTWKFAGNTLTVSGSGDMYDFDGDAPWAKHRDEIYYVVIEDGVTSVGANAFHNYDKLENVIIGRSVRVIGTRAFADCDGLTAVSLPASFREFGEESFKSCSNLKKFEFAGGMPKFRLNCLWDTYAKLIYPEKNPWPLEHIKQLEEAFQGRIEFLSSDGTDPYTPEEEKPQETTKPAETTKPTEETKATEATEAATRATEPVETIPLEEPMEETEAPETVTTETVPPFTFGRPEEEEDRGGIGLGWVITLVVVMVLCLAGIGFLAFRLYRDRQEEEYDDYEDEFEDEFSQLGQRTNEFVQNTDFDTDIVKPRKPQQPVQSQKPVQPQQPAQPQKPHKPTVAETMEKKAQQAAEREEKKPHKKGGKYCK